jgi:hypothetical protein
MTVSKKQNLWLLKFNAVQSYCQKSAKERNCLWQLGMIFLFSYGTFGPVFHWIFLFHYCNVGIIIVNDRHLSRSQVCHKRHTESAAYTKWHISKFVMELIFPRINLNWFWLHDSSLIRYCIPCSCFLPVYMYFPLFLNGCFWSSHWHHKSHESYCVQVTLTWK